MNITISLSQLESLLNQQKNLVAKKLLGQTYSFNPESTEGNLKSMNIDKTTFEKIAMETRYPDDVEVLKKYIK